MSASPAPGPGGVRSWLRDRPVAVKIFGAVMAGCLGMLAIATTALLSLTEMEEGSVAMSSRSVEPLRAMDEVRRAYLQTRVDALADGWLGGTDASKEHTAYLADLEAMDTALATMAAQPLTGEQKHAVAEMQRVWPQYKTLVSGRLLAFARAGDTAGYTALRTKEIKPIAATIQSSLDTLASSLTAQSTAQAQQDRKVFAEARVTMIAVSIVALVLAIGLAWLVERSIVIPLRRVRDVCAAVAEGQLSRRVDLPGQDEIAQTAHAVDAATANTQEAVKALEDASRDLSMSATELAAATGSIAGSTSNTSTQAEAATGAAHAVSSNVQAVAASTEEMTSAIDEISRTATEAARLGGQAGELAESTTQTVSKLGDSSAEIGNVVRLITSIAEQTNLLALNATIEAARAGESGKGFAVVATEVKELAQETARATDDISERVRAIQEDTSGAVQAISEITAVIAELSSFQSAIAAAVEEQTATTGEITRSVAGASQRTDEIALAVAAVSSATQDIAGGTEQARHAAAHLSEMSEHLHGLVRRFEH